MSVSSLGIAWLAVWAVVGYYVGKDMERRGREFPSWWIVVFILGPLGLLIWLVARTNHDRVR